jgi:hypothetical protein
MRYSRFKRKAQRFLVHMGDHQQFAVARIGNDSGDEARCVEARHESRAFFYGLLVGRLGGKEAHSQPFICGSGS